MSRPLTSTLFLSSMTVLALAACSIPTEPEGVGEQGMTNIAIRMQQQGDDEGASDFYQRALQHKPDDRLALRNLAALLEAHGNYADAEHYEATLLRYAPDDKEAGYTDGRLLLRLGRPAEARDLYQKILNDDRHDVKAQNGLGVALDYLGQHEEAENQYRVALEREPDNLVTLNNLAHSYVLVGRYDDAIALLEPHAADKAATPALRQNLAEAYGMVGMYVDAERLARVDLKPLDVKRNLAWYRARRAKLAPEPKFVADLGSYPTNDIADATAENARAALGDTNPAIALSIKPQVQTIGGTPSFTLRATGFTNASSLKSFCDLMVNSGISCTRRP